MDHNSANAAGALLASFGLIIWLVFMAIIVLGFIVNWRIVSKAGYNGALSLLALIPIVGFVMVIIFAFSKWPIEERLEAAGR